MILFSRKVTPLRIMLKDGTKVGEIWRFPKRSQGYGLQLDGIYWRNGEPNKRGGASCKAFPTLREARIAAVDAALDHLALPRR